MLRQPRRKGARLAAVCVTSTVTTLVLAGFATGASAAPSHFPAPTLAKPVAARFDLEGHRGTRGLRPEDTLPAFAKALDVGVRTLELDTGVT